MHDFVYKNGEMVCEKVSLARLAREAGTPCYIYSFKTLVEHLQKLQRALKELNPLICFSMKSNSNLAVCKVLVSYGAGLDIVSGGELYRALKIGANPRKIVFAGVGKSDGEIKEALRRKILFFNVESLPELERINQIAEQERRIPNIALRVNPNVESSTHHYIKTGVGTSKFGLDFETAVRLFDEKKKYSFIRFAGIHVHIGSQITEAAPFIRALRKTIDLVERLRKMGHRVEWLNIGGGLGIIYQKETPLTPQQFAKAVIPILKGRDLRIILEPGRFISGNAGILLTRIQYLKETPSKQFVIVDASMGDLIRPSLYGAYHEILPVVKKRSKLQAPSSKPIDVVGPICESGDFLGKDRHLPMLQQGDLLAVMSAGAYGFTMASNYNSRPLPAEVMVKGRRFTIVRRRETYTDLIQGEKIPPFLEGSHGKAPLGH